jgi:hypothetical protein
MTSEIRVRLADQSAIKVVGSLNTSVNDIPGFDVTGAVEGSYLRYNFAEGKWKVTNTLDVNQSTKLRIKRTSLATTSFSLEFGEPAVSTGIGTAGDTGGRLWVGNSTGNAVQVGGEYYTSMLDQEHGILTADSAVIVDQNKYIDFFNVINGVVVGGGITASTVNITAGGIVSGDLVIDSVGIGSNRIYTKSTSDVLYLDPSPEGLHNGGTVVIKGNLQVDGTSSIVNSSILSSNEIIFNIGDSSTVRTVIGNVSIGASIFTLDSVVGINTGDIINGISGLNPSIQLRTITAYNSTSKTITIAGVTTAGISSGSQLTIDHGYDTNTDRGISFDYNDSSAGVGYTANRKGFFGYDDSTKKWTYIPETTITNGVVSGTRGYIDIRGIYLQPAEVNQYGIAYLDSDGYVNHTGSPGTGISTSNYILTTTLGSNVPVWTNTIDGGSY